MAQKSPTSRTADEVSGKILKRDADLLVALIGDVLKTNFAGLGGNLNEKLPGESPAEF
jgi:hypothetical protein